jgi:hypothetical protein
MPRISSASGTIGDMPVVIGTRDGVGFAALRPSGEADAAEVQS